QVPAPLRDDDAHAARLLPRYLVDGADAASVEAHIADCPGCAALLTDLRGSAARLQRTTLSAAGFGALGAIVPTASPLSAGTAAAVAMTAGAGMTGGMITGGIGALALGTLIVSGLLVGAAPVEPPPIASGVSGVSTAGSVAGDDTGRRAGPDPA